MPVDLSQIGPARALPPRVLRWRVWLLAWIVICVLGAAIVLLLWPKGIPARGIVFGLWALGAPNVILFVTLGFARGGYENKYLNAVYYNQHREKRRKELIARGQQSLRILAISNRLPLDGQALAETIMQGPPVLKAQPLRNGEGVVRHARLPESTLSGKDTPGNEIAAIRSQVLQSKPLTPYGDLFAYLLAPLVPVLRDLQESGIAPAVRAVMEDSAATSSQLAQLRAVINACGLSLPDCRFGSSDDGFLLADEWLDKHPQRSMLVIAAQLRQGFPEDSAEGGASVLLVPSTMKLPKDLILEPLATLHRPMAVPEDKRVTALKTALLWGKTSANHVKRAWLTGFDAKENAGLVKALRNSGLDELASASARYSPDQSIGHAGAAAEWILVAAAAESDLEDPQLLLARGQSMQAAVLYSHRKPVDDHRNAQGTD